MPFFKGIGVAFQAQYLLFYRIWQRPETQGHHQQQAFGNGSLHISHERLQSFVL